LKSVTDTDTTDTTDVTPFAGVWIEISNAFGGYELIFVTPFAGVWIEIKGVQSDTLVGMLSLPLRECGLKFGELAVRAMTDPVTPFAGVWIEIRDGST